jgi:exonuclease SbcD
MSTTFLHTSDWHLGKKLYRLDRLPEQESFLDDLINICKTENITHLLLAGDIFDSPQPPHKALLLWTHFLSRLITETKTKLWAIAGNHDSSLLIDMPQSLIDSKRIILRGQISKNPEDHWIEDEEFHLCLLPYFRPHEIINWATYFNLKADSTDLELIKDILKNFFKLKSSSSKPKIFLGHHLFGEYEYSGSEQIVYLSGLESISLDWLGDFTYCALGHIHKPQTVRKNNPLAIYSGSPLSLRFKETFKKRMVKIKTLSPLEIENHNLPNHRDLKSIHTTLLNWEKDFSDYKNQKTMLPTIEAIINLKSPEIGLAEKIKKWCFDHEIELLNLNFYYEQTDQPKVALPNLLDKTMPQLFETFYLEKFPKAQSVPTELMNDFLTLMSEDYENPSS